MRGAFPARRAAAWPVGHLPDQPGQALALPGAGDAIDFLKMPESQPFNLPFQLPDTGCQQPGLKCVAAFQQEKKLPFQGHDAIADGLGAVKIPGF